MSTRFNRPNADYDGAVALTNRDKYQQDSATSPKVAIDSSHVDGDINYVVDALNSLDDDVNAVVAGGVPDSSIDNAKLRDSAAYSVIGRASGTAGEVADITALTDNTVLKRDGTSLTFGKVSTDEIENSAITNDQIANSTIEASKLNFSVTPSPSGIVSPFAGATAPSGWLICDGTAVSRNAYPDLYAVVGDTYGAGNGTTTFNLPDLRGRSVFGVDTTNENLTSGDLAASGGVETTSTDEHSLTVDQIPAHSHTIPARVGTDSDGKSGVSGLQQTGSSVTEDTGGGLGHSHDFNTMSPYLILNYIIKT